MAACVESVMLDSTRDGQPSQRPMSALERRKINRVLARAVALSLISSGEYKGDPVIDPVNRVLERWAISIGDGMSEKWDDSRKSRLSPLDDLTAITVDQTILRSSPRCQRFVREWYCGTGTSTVLQKRLGVDRAGLEMEWRATLLYLRDRFLATGDRQLASLLERLD